MKTQSQAGSLLLASLSFIIMLAVAAGSLLDLTMNSYKLSLRNEVRAAARTVAETEMDALYYQFMLQVMSATPPALMSGALGPGGLNLCDLGTVPTTNRQAFLVDHQSAGWVIRRSVYYNSVYDTFTGVMPGTTKTGTITYLTVYIEVLPGPTNFYRNSLAVRVGRRFATSTESIFQYGIFYQGDLEMAPGGNVSINGDVCANGSIYMGASGGGTLTLNGQVRYMDTGYFNQDSLGNTVLRKPNTPVGGALNPPVFGTSQATQLETMTEPENLQGGVDAGNEVALRPDLFPTQNDVYRALIVPPPSVAPGEYPNADPSLGDDPTIGVQRIYNRAGLRITVNTDNSVTITKPDGTVVNSNFAGVVTGTSSMYDQREGKNINVTSVDMGVLTTQLSANYPTFNGVLYVNIKSSNSTTPGALRLTNATTIPQGNGNGFSVATNGGVYVQGNYNTTTPALADGSRNPAMIMGDAVTVLSSGWSDTNAAGALSTRVASGDITVNAGLLTGNTSATSTNASGGAQNLVRYLENWNASNVTVNGSLGRLFDAKTFTGPYQQPINVYGIPHSRNFVFDAGLKTHPPAGSPQTTAFTRGTFFVW